MFSKFDFPIWSRTGVLLALALLPAIHSQGQHEIVFISDTQAPMWVEKMVLKSNNNIKATSLAFNDILKKKPASVYILGDVVTLGYKKKKWTRMDCYLDSCRTAGIQVSALLGNHDVMTRPRKGELQFNKRFPDHIRTGFFQIVDSVAIVFLNSNFKKLTQEELKQQQSWLQKTLQYLDADSSVVVTLIACHHAPFTNSKVVGSSKTVQQYFVPDYLKSSKAKLFITGHSHNFELFKQKGKDFLVIGGGGGLTQPLEVSTRSIPDLSSSYKPQFHYLVVKRYAQSLCVTSRYLNNDFSGFKEGLSFSIPIH